VKEMSVGERLAVARRLAGLSQLRAAHVISMDEVEPRFIVGGGQLSNYETGKINIPAKKFFKIIGAYERYSLK
jgi:transcriptional regulator with XRE-family HTH domain